MGVRCLEKGFLATRQATPTDTQQSKGKLSLPSSVQTADMGAKQIIDVLSQKKKNHIISVKHSHAQVLINQHFWTPK